MKFNRQKRSVVYNKEHIQEDINIGDSKIIRPVVIKSIIYIFKFLKEVNFIQLIRKTSETIHNASIFEGTFSHFMDLNKLTWFSLNFNFDWPGKHKKVYKQTVSDQFLTCKRSKSKVNSLK